MADFNYFFMKTLRSLSFAWNGLRHSFKTQANFRMQLLAALATVGLAFALRISNTEWLAVLICITIVLFAELANTAIEKLCDVVKPEIHPGIKLVKDISAGAVLLTAIICFIAGLLIFLPKIIVVIKSF